MAQKHIVEVKAKDGSVVFKCYYFKELYLPLMIKDPEKRFREIKELEYGPGDVFIVSYPKVGTHWVMDSVSMLKKGKAEVTQPDFTMLELTKSFDEFKERERNRLVVSHLWPQHLSENFQTNGKFILQLRNPKDAAVSMFYHFRKSKEVRLQCSWADFIELFGRGQVIFGSFFDYYYNWQEFVSTHQDQVLIVYYEDMHKNYEKELRRMAAFLELNVTDETIQQIAIKGGNVQTVKDEIMKDPKAQELGKAMTDDGVLPFYRKGEVGDWKNHFTVAQNETFERIIEKRMEKSMFKFDYFLSADRI